MAFPQSPIQVDNDSHAETGQVWYCSICLHDSSTEDCQKVELGRPKGCAHVFCFECICKWASKKGQCPLCKIGFQYVERLKSSDHSVIDVQPIQVTPETDTEDESELIFIEADTGRPSWTGFTTADGYLIDGFVVPDSNESDVDDWYAATDSDYDAVDEDFNDYDHDYDVCEENEDNDFDDDDDNDDDEEDDKEDEGEDNKLTENHSIDKPKYSANKSISSKPQKKTSAARHTQVQREGSWISCNSQQDFPSIQFEVASRLRLRSVTRRTHETNPCLRRNNRSQRRRNTSAISLTSRRRTAFTRNTSNNTMQPRSTRSDRRSGERATSRRHTRTETRRVSSSVLAVRNSNIEIPAASFLNPKDNSSCTSQLTVAERKLHSSSHNRKIVIFSSDDDDDLRVRFGPHTSHKDLPGSEKLASLPSISNENSTSSSQPTAMISGQASDEEALQQENRNPEQMTSGRGNYLQTNGLKDTINSFLQRNQKRAPVDTMNSKVSISPCFNRHQQRSRTTLRRSRRITCRQRLLGEKTKQS
eukprot:gene10209-2366_t